MSTKSCICLLNLKLEKWLRECEPGLLSKVPNIQSSKLFDRASASLESLSSKWPLHVLRLFFYLATFVKTASADSTPFALFNSSHEHKKPKLYLQFGRKLFITQHVADRITACCAIETAYNGNEKELHGRTWL